MEITYKLYSIQFNTGQKAIESLEEPKYEDIMFQYHFFRLQVYLRPPFLVSWNMILFSFIDIQRIYFIYVLCRYYIL